MSKPGPICYIEIGATDVVRTAQFYDSVFGWEFADISSTGYSTFGTGDGIGGGIYRTDKIKPGGGIIVYIAVDDITATLDLVTSAGGKTIVPKSEIPGTGWYGHFADPDGNNLGLFCLRTA
jgi:predicted enzyme related to lactoylglutathione lyase